MRIYALAVYLFLYIPIGIIVLFSFNAGRHASAGARSGARAIELTGPRRAGDAYRKFHEPKGHDAAFPSDNLRPGRAPRSVGSACAVAARPVP